MKKVTKIEALCVMIACVALVFGVVIGFGTLGSGWHLVDDHEYFSYIQRFDNGEALSDIIVDTVLEDVNETHRLRFCYFPLRVLQAYLFRFNYIAYSLVKAVLAVFSAFFLYLCGRELRLSRWNSALFTLISMVGAQSATWWKLGPQHIQATLFFAIGFYLMLKYLKNKSLPLGIISIVSYALMANYHESFVIIIPFIMLYVISYFIYERFGEGTEFKTIFKKETLLEILRSIKGYLWYLVAIAILLIVLMAMIVFGVGINSVDIGVSISPADNIRNIVESLRGDFRPYYYFGLFNFGILLTFYDRLKKVWLDILMTIVFLAPQFVLYAKSGFYERYLLPMCIGYAFFFVAVGIGKNVIYGWRKSVYTVVICITILCNVRRVAIEADYYRFRGESVTNMLETAEDMTAKGFNVVSCLGICNPEADITVRGYLKAKGLAEGVYWTDYLENYSTQDADLVMVYNRDDRHYVVSPAVDFSGMHFVKCGSIDLFFSDRAFETLTEADKEELKVKPTIYGIGLDTYGY